MYVTRSRVGLYVSAELLAGEVIVEVGVDSASERITCTFLLSGTTLMVLGEFTCSVLIGFGDVVLLSIDITSLRFVFGVTVVWLLTS